MRRDRWVVLVLAVVGAGLTLVAWMGPHVVGGDGGAMAGYGASFLFNLLLVVLLWFAARRTEGRASGFWRRLAVAWSLGFAGNVAWGLHDYLSGTPLPTLSWIDGFYVGRYAFVLAAFWLYIPPWRKRRRFDWVALLLAAALFVWFVLLRPAMRATGLPFLYFAGVALYPVLDAPLIYAALAAWTAPTRPLRPAMPLLALSTIAYAVANWLNFGERVVTLEAYLGLADFFWQLSDLLVAVAVLYGLFSIGGDGSQGAGEGRGAVV